MPYCFRMELGRRILSGAAAVNEKSNEITAMPKVPESIEIKGQVVMIDAM